MQPPLFAISPMLDDENIEPGGVRAWRRSWGLRRDVPKCGCNRQRRCDLRLASRRRGVEPSARRAIRPPLDVCLGPTSQRHIAGGPCSLRKRESASHLVARSGGWAAQQVGAPRRLLTRQVQPTCSLAGGTGHAKRRVAGSIPNSRLMPAFPPWGVAAQGAGGLRTSALVQVKGNCPSGRGLEHAGCRLPLRMAPAPVSSMTLCWLRCWGGTRCAVGSRGTAPRGCRLPPEIRAPAVAWLVCHRRGSADTPCAILRSRPST